MRHLNSIHQYYVSSPFYLKCLIFLEFYNELEIFGDLSLVCNVLEVRLKDLVFLRILLPLFPIRKSTLSKIPSSTSRSCWLVYPLRFADMYKFTSYIWFLFKTFQIRGVNKYIFQFSY